MIIRLCCSLAIAWGVVVWVGCPQLAAQVPVNQAVAGEPLAHQGRASQILVRAEYLMVSPQVRASIYERVAQTRWGKQTQMPANEEDSVELANFSGEAECRQHVRSPLRCNQVVLDRSEVLSITQQVESDTSSTRRRVPEMILIEGKTAEANDVIEHPLVISPAGSQGTGSQRTQAVSAAATPIQTLQAGTRLALLARQDASGKLSVTLQLRCSRLEPQPDIQIAIEGQKMASLPMIRQVDQTFTLAATLDARPSAAQGLLVDPHYQVQQDVRQEKPIPILGKIPYLGASLKTNKSESVSQHLLVLISPQLVSSR